MPRVWVYRGLAGDLEALRGVRHAMRKCLGGLLDLCHGPRNEKKVDDRETGGGEPRAYSICHDLLFRRSVIDLCLINELILFFKNNFIFFLL